MTAPCVVERPNGTTYRARLAPTALYWEEDSGQLPVYGVSVFRTHDVELALELAIAACRTEGEGTEILSASERVWLRRDRGRSWVRAEASERGALPAVVFTVVDW